MEQDTTSMRTVRKTVTDTLKPPPDQDRALERIVRWGRARSHCALEQRHTWWRQGPQGPQGPQGKSAIRSQQEEAASQELRAAFGEYAALHRQILPDLPARL